jgi:flagellar biosynthesis protein FliQ
MASIFRSRLFRSVVSYIIAATSFLITCYGGLLIVASLNSNTSSGGSTLVFIAGLILLAAAGAVFAVWLVHWRVQLHTEIEKNN